MKKRVHEIAKEHGMPAKDLLARLREAGVEVKAASSSVEEATAARVLGNGDGSPASMAKPSTNAKAATSAQPGAGASQAKPAAPATSQANPAPAASQANPAPAASQANP
ncbi:MAG: translation initiation factor IF-2 N-terminal domain-containing protein, partial [Solirubrobacteraceae bacterium]